MKFESYIAKRYIVSKHKVNFITIISLLSVAGITIGVAALIVVLSVFNGFGSLVTSYLVNFDPQVRIEVASKEGYKALPAVEPLIKRLPEVTNYTPFVNGKVLALQGKINKVVSIKGINPENGEAVYGIKKNLVYGRFDLSEKNGTPGIIIGFQLQEKLQALVGDTITIVSPAGLEKVISRFSMPVTKKFVVRGIYQSNNNEYDAFYLFADLSQVQEVLGLTGKIQGFDVRLGDINKSNGVKEEIAKNVDGNLITVSSWYDFHKDLYSVMKIERWAAYIILSLIIAIATFNILGSLTMSVIEKKRDIGVLTSLGATEKSIMKIFMFEGLLIGVIGTLCGAALGYLVCYIQVHYNIYPLDPLQYKIDSLPLEVRVSDFFAVGGASVFLSFLASLYPAKKAAKVNALDAIKWE
jgi:lipoprotein-releasing system permease protein